MITWVLLLLFALAGVANGSNTFCPIATLVSGLWLISSKHSELEYQHWLYRALPLNAPMVFFYEDPKVRSWVSNARGSLPTTFVHRSLHQLRTGNTNKTWTHGTHVPSYALGLVWLNKVPLMAEVAQWNIYNSTWLTWLDAGNAAFRGSVVPGKPWPQQDLVSVLPDHKLIYTDSGETRDGHSFAGTAFMFSVGKAQHFADQFIAAVDTCATEIHDYRCMSDQISKSLLNSAPSQLT